MLHTRYVATKDLFQALIRAKRALRSPSDDAQVEASPPEDACHEACFYEDCLYEDA